MYGTEITHKVLSKHLKHLEGKNLVKRTEEGFQNVTYALSDKFTNVMKLPKEEIKKYFEIQKDDSLPPRLRALKITKEELYSKFSTDQIDRETDRDLHDIMSLNLWELKLSIDNELLLKEGESHDSFWLYFVKPTYRIQMERASEKCRYNIRYREILFEKIDLLINQLRNDRELVNKKKAKNSFNI